MHFQSVFLILEQTNNFSGRIRPFMEPNEIWVQLTMAGNLRERFRRVFPTKEKQRTHLSTRPETIFSTSSSGSKSGISPLANLSLMRTKNFSSPTWASVIYKVQWKSNEFSFSMRETHKKLHIFCVHTKLPARITFWSDFYALALRQTSNAVIWLGEPV